MKLVRLVNQLKKKLKRKILIKNNKKENKNLTQVYQNFNLYSHQKMVEPQIKSIVIRKKEVRKSIIMINNCLKRKTIQKIRRQINLRLRIIKNNKNTKNMIKIMF